MRVAPAGSTLTIDRRTTPDGDAVELHVIDEGPGMTPADRRRAFDRFWRAPDATDDGSGLGLAIVAQLVRASGGTVALDAAPGTGIDAAVRLRSATRDRRAGWDRSPARHRHPQTAARV
ncbi:sensor histidine kinase [Spirilliplanes yamanashiensis]|uniref:sensor histidine kinase n=1 Tax=Spirilliplanes yamanashiensis TaxID=42233 RepID=UPI0027D874F2|nr:ATP-binding protein [Spirilliplanes yamanashiensis]